MAQQVTQQPTEFGKQPTSQLGQFHLDPRLKPTNFKVLDNLDSRQQIQVDASDGRGPYRENDKLVFKWQDHASLWDTTSSHLVITIENENQDFFDWSDGINCVVGEDVEILAGNTVIEKVKSGGRLSQHLILGTASQDHYDNELNALQKSYRYRSFKHRYEPNIAGDAYNLSNTQNPLFTDKDIEWRHSADGKTMTAIVHLDHSAFFRSSDFKTAFLEHEIRIKLPPAVKVFEARKDVTLGAQQPSYKITSAHMNVDILYPEQQILSSLFDKVDQPGQGLVSVLDDAVETFRRPLQASSQNNIILQAPFSNVQSLVMMVVDKQDSRTVDNVNYCPCPYLDSYQVKLSNTELGVRGGVEGGVEGAYTQYRKMYNMLTDISGQGMMDYQRFKNEHTPLCLSTEILRDAPAQVMQNSVDTTSRAGQLVIDLNLKDDTGAQQTFINNLSNKELLIYVFHKKIVKMAGSKVIVGE